MRESARFVLGITALDPFRISRLGSPAAPAWGQVVVGSNPATPTKFKDLRGVNPAASLFLPIASLSADKNLGPRHLVALRYPSVVALSACPSSARTCASTSRRGASPQRPDCGSRGTWAGCRRRSQPIADGREPARDIDVQHLRVMHAPFARFALPSRRSGMRCTMKGDDVVCAAPRHQRKERPIGVDNLQPHRVLPSVFWRHDEQRAVAVIGEGRRSRPRAAAA